MLVRIVKMTFRPEAVEAFKAFFDERKEKIRHFKGCTYLELLQENSNTNIFFTYSHWQSEDSLMHYRNSSFFRETWQLTKLLFAAKAEAWSVSQIAIIT